MGQFESFTATSRTCKIKTDVVELYGCSNNKTPIQVEA